MSIKQQPEQTRPDRPGKVPGRLAERAPKAAWLLIAGTCLLYGPISINFAWHLFSQHAPWLWDHIYTAVVGQRQAEGPGSAFLRQAGAYERSRVVLLVHTMAAGAAVMLAVSQFSNALRTRRPRVHRALGRAYLLLVALGMLTAAAYLIQIGPYGTFDGPPFYLLLWSLDLGTMGTAVLALVAIRRRDIASHQSLVALSFALLFSAPLLRVLWLGFGAADPGATQETIVLLSSTLATVAVLGGAALATRHFDRRAARVAAVPPIVSAGAGRAIAVAGALGACGVVAIYVARGGTLDAMLIGSVAAVAAWLALCTAMEVWGRRGDNLMAAEEWRLHKLAIAGTAIPLALAWPLFGLAFSGEQAFQGAVLIAPGTTMTLGILVVIWQRQRSAPMRVRQLTVSGAPPSRQGRREVARPLGKGWATATGDRLSTESSAD
jgi:uncharacterized membrane protein